jgi:hypothetical protein
MADITALILADHEWFREQFAKLDDLQARPPVSGARRSSGCGARWATDWTCTHT